MNKELSLIKNKYGEAMMHFCRANFSTLLEEEGLLYSILSNHFDYSKNLFYDIKMQKKEEEFITYIYSLTNHRFEDSTIVNKSPLELLSDAGYDLYECKTEEEIQSFKKYYASGEKLCTFNGGRLNRCYVFFAVKKDVQNIKRKDFKKPERQNAYGTSVISIQFTKGNTNILSIKNRYNHTVNNPDATFSNNLDNIIPGLTKAFEKEYNLKITSGRENFELENYVLAFDNGKLKYFKYNYEINNIYYCPNNVLINNYFVQRFDKDRYLVFDYFIFDMKEKIVKIYDKDYIDDSFISTLGNIEKIDIIKEKNNKKILINDQIEIGLDSENNILSYDNCNIKEIGDYFLTFNKTLNNLKLDNVVTINNYFMNRNKELKYLHFPNLEIVNNNFLFANEDLKCLDAPKLKEIGENFMPYNRWLEELKLPELIKTGCYFLNKNKNLEILDLPKLERAGYNFLSDNSIIKKVYLPNLKYVSNSFLRLNQNLKILDLPSLEVASNNFLEKNEIIEYINLPKLSVILDKFLLCNKNLKIINLPSVKHIDDAFLLYNTEVTDINMPNIEYVGERFIYNNSNIEYINMPKLSKEKLDEIVNRISYLKQKIRDFIYAESRFDKIKRLFRNLTKKRA